MKETEKAMYPYFCIKHRYVCQLMVKPCPECEIISSNLSKVIEYEKVMVEHLIREESEKGIKLDLDNQTDKLVFKVMSEKISGKRFD